MSAAMAGLGLILAPALPLALLLLFRVPGLRGRIERWTPWAAVPALLLALGGEPGTSVRLDWLLFGSVLALDALSRVFLVFTALLWLGAGISAHGMLVRDERASGFRLFWLTTMAGNFGLILARDVPTFYACFTLMTFAAYGLIVHSRSRAALDAGRVYLTMAIVGEGLIVAGLVLAASRTVTPLTAMLADLPAAVAGSPHRDLTLACLLLGFGVKAGLPLLHMWLPLAHPVAPIPASAVLSGAMIKAGLFGWLQTLPLGLVALPQWGAGVIVAGFIAAWGSALIGIHQRTPKTVLAYSSIGQIGLITVGIGAGLHQPALWPALAPALTLYALHHGLAKGALFLGVGVANQGDRRWRYGLWLALTLPGLSLAGPMLSGAAAKITLKIALESAIAPPTWWQSLPLLLGIAAVGTTALIARYLWLLHRAQPRAAATRWQWSGWGLVLGASVFALVLLPWVAQTAGMPPDPLHLPALVWPVLVGAALALAAARRLQAWPLPAGDLIVLFSWLAQRLEETAHRSSRAARDTAEHLRQHLYRPKFTLSDSQPESSSLEYSLRRNAALVLTVLLAWAMLILLIGLH